MSSVAECPKCRTSFVFHIPKNELFVAASEVSNSSSFYVRKIIPNNNKLVEVAKTHMPPPEWFEQEEECPF